MSGTREDYVKYRIGKARSILNDATLLADNERWVSCMNRLYYACYYAVSALLLKNNFEIHTHNGIKTKFFLEFIKTEKLSREYSQLYSNLFTWRQEGDYADLYEFTKEQVLPLISEVDSFINAIESLI